MNSTLSFEEAVRRLLSFLETGAPRTLIGLAGLPGGGKSTVAVQLANAVNERAGEGTMMALGMDGFHLPKSALRQMPDPDAAFARRGAPWTFDAAAFGQRLQALRDAGGEGTVTWPDFQHGVGDPVDDAFTVAPSVRIILVEGLYLLHQLDVWDEVSRQFDERWYLDVPIDVAMSRLKQRHMNSWNISADEAETRIGRNDGLNAQIVAGTRSHADWLLAENTPFV